MKTNVQEFLGNLEGGVLDEALANILSDVAFAVRNSDSRIKGRVNLSLSFERFGDDQVMITHKLDFRKPTNKGSIQEDRESQTPMFVNKGDEWVEQWKAGDFICIVFDFTESRYFYEVKSIRDKDILLVFSTMFVYSHADKGLVWCDMLDNGKIYEMQEDK